MPNKHPAAQQILSSQFMSLNPNGTAIQLMRLQPFHNTIMHTQALGKLPIIARQSNTSCFLKKVKQEPNSPALAVRPARCMYVFTYGGIS